MAKDKMHRRRCYFGRYIKFSTNFFKILQKTIDFKDLLCYHNKCTEEHMKNI